jgi:general secretion pathway protein G
VSQTDAAREVVIKGNYEKSHGLLIDPSDNLLKTNKPRRYAMLQRNPQPERRLAVRAAFTLMELLVVMAIIVIIAGFGGYYVIGQLNESKVTQAKIKAKNVAKAVDTYYIDHGTYPQQLDQLLQKSEIGKGPYLTSREEILDPWNQPFQYDQSGQKNQQVGAVIQTPDVFTTTPDGRTIGNWSDQRK